MCNKNNVKKLWFINITEDLIDFSFFNKKNIKLNAKKTFLDDKLLNNNLN